MLVTEWLLCSANNHHIVLSVCMDKLIILVLMFRSLMRSRWIMCVRKVRRTYKGQREDYEISRQQSYLRQNANKSPKTQLQEV